MLHKQNASLSARSLVDYTEKMKGKVVLVNKSKNFCNEIANISENVKSLVSINERLTGELMVVKKRKQHF